jgi:hypothetical protein
MNSLMRDLAIGAGISALTVALALAWGGPFAATSETYTQEEDLQLQMQASRQGPLQQPESSQSKASTFNGTIVSDGRQYSLRDPSGAVYRLDDSDRAKPYEGRAVKVRGTFDEQANVIHVESIEVAEG